MDLLEEAKRRYPIGTLFTSIDDSDRTRIIEPFEPEKDNTVTFYMDGTDIRIDNGIKTGTMTPYQGCSNPRVYADGQWMEIKQHYMTEVNEKTLVDGQTYVVQQNKDQDTHLMRQGGGNYYICLPAAGTSSKSVHKSYNHSGHGTWKYRVANTEERAWLQACMEAGKIVKKPEKPVPQVVNEYLIY